MRSAARAGSLVIVAMTVALFPGCASGADNQSAAPARTGAAPASGSASASTSGSTAAASSASTTASGSASASSSTAGGGSYALFFGDSNFVGGGCTPDPQQDMARIAGDRLGYRTVIRGAGGTGFATGNASFGLKNFLVQVRQGALDLSTAPSLVVIEGGSNDGTKVRAAARNAKKVVRAAQSLYPQALIVMMGPIDVRAGRGDVVPRIVPALQGAAQHVDVPFLNAYQWLPWRTQAGLVCSDYDHATLAGQQILGDTLADQLQDVGAA